MIWFCDKLTPAALAMVLVILASPPGRTADGPEAVARDFFLSSLKGDKARAYLLLSHEDRNVVPLDEWTWPWATALFPSQWRIENLTVERQDDRAKVTMDVSFPELELIQLRARSSALRDAMLTKALRDLADHGPSAQPRAHERYELNVRLDRQARWVIFADLAGALMLRRRYELSGKLDRADSKQHKIEILREHLGANPTDRKAQEDLDRLEQEVLYLSKVEISGLHVAEGERFGQREKGVFGTLRNTGDRTLDKVLVTTFFLDRDGRAMHEKSYHAVLHRGSSTGRRGDPPLRPNYRESFGYTTEDVPDGWAGRVTARVTEVEFSAREQSPVVVPISPDQVGRIETFQHILAELGLYEGAIDGIEGPKMRRAIGVFQRRAGLEETGLLDPVTIERLLEAEGGS